MGVGNCDDIISGEKYFLKYLFKKKRREQERTIVDIGANIGNYSLLVNAISESVKIHAIEPVPNNYTELCKNVLHVNNIIPYNMAINEQSGVLSIYDYDDNNSEHASLYKEVFTRLHNNSKVEEFTVKAMSLDEFCEINHIENIFLLKIDTEGNEYNILRSAKRMFAEKKIEIIQFEFNEMNVVSRVFFKDFYDLLHEDYCIYRLLPKGFLPIRKYKPNQQEWFMFQNIVCIRNDIAF
jgi:FkbM family methyltransferase